MIRVLLVDDQVLFRESIGRLFAAEPDIEVAGQCGTTAEALLELKRLELDVLVANARMGAAFVTAARDTGSTARVVVIADHCEPESSLAVLYAGASAILYRDSSPDSLIRAIRLAASGSAWIDGRTMQLLADERGATRLALKLSHREQLVLDRIVHGMTNRKIAEELDVSEGTVKGVLRGLFLRTGTRSRAQLVRRALERFRTP